MENQAQLFNYEDHKIRVVEKDGQPWWIAKDVCVALEMKQTAAQCLEKLDDDEKLMSVITTSGQKRDINRQNTRSEKQKRDKSLKNKKLPVFILH